LTGSLSNPDVVVPLTMSAYTLLQRNPLSTAMTWAQRLVVLVAASPGHRRPHRRHRPAVTHCGHPHGRRRGQPLRRSRKCRLQPAWQPGPDTAVNQSPPRFGDPRVQALADALDPLL